MYDISVIITTYNAEETVNRAVSSLLHKPFIDRIEIIIVDDCSSDNTPQIIQKFAEKFDNIKVCLLDINTGSPSEPRNIGMNIATGEYLTFLDDDDSSNIEGLMKMYDYAKKNHYDFVKGYLTVINNGKQQIVDRLYNTTKMTNHELMEAFVAKQSTRIDFLLLNKFRKQFDIRFDCNLKIGEDTVFYTEIFKHNPKVGYCNTFTQYHFKRINLNNLSSTQKYQDKELLNHLTAWNLAEKNLCKIGSSYFSLRLQIAVRNTLASIISFSKGMISEDVFKYFSTFINTNKHYLKSIYLTSRYQELYKTILAGDYSAFQQVSKKRILIAGYDLKFILPIVPYLEKEYIVLIDEWTGHNRHDERKSKALLEQADIIWCEWLLGNAVWYSQNKLKHQKLVIRAHRFEINREFGYQVNYAVVDKVLAVGYYYLEEFRRMFNIPREKMQLISNYVETELYNGQKNKGALHHIGLIGITPSRKGFLKGLKIIKKLREKDSRFELYVIGTKPQDTPWIMNNPIEKEYYKKCEKFIAENHLEEAVKFKGWLRKDEMFKDLGFVLSLSDYEQPESFHLTPAEAYCDDTMGLFLAWPGVEYIYPDNIIFNNEEEIEEHILDMSLHESEYFQKISEVKKYIIENYNIKLFCEKTINILETL